MSAENPIPDSYSIEDHDVATAPNGGRAHKSLIDQTRRLELKLWSVCDRVWTVVGNGLSNQSFVEGPEGLIVIDTGECVEEMAAALQMVREHTSAPVAGVIYTHYHYVSGTKALFDTAEVPIWGHAKIATNLSKVGTELSAAAGRGIIHQFGVWLPDTGEDALVNAGLGLGYRNKAHAPYTSGFIAPTHTFDQPTSTTIAGLKVEFTPAPSDSDDSVTVWFPELGVAAHNILWPALFNVFAIRGEEYRDPRVLLTGLDHLASLGAQHLIATHGPPLSGAEAILAETTTFRDSIQFMWDQTVRGINKGLSVDELSHFVQLPDCYGQSFFTQQHYGLVEHHVKQIHAGLRGWFDGDEARLFPVPPAEKAKRLIAGFGGRDVVRAQVRRALDELDLRWALELASWLVHCDTDDSGRADGGSSADRQLLAFVLREAAQRTTSANVRNWALTRALELEGHLDMTRHRQHRFGAAAVAANPVGAFHALRVLVEPSKVPSAPVHLSIELEDERAGLVLRNGVAVPTDGVGADIGISTDVATLAALMAGRATLSELIASGAIRTDNSEGVVEFFAAFDHQGLTG